jgi:hypothetical protein
LRRVLRGDAVAPSSSRALIMRRSLPHGHVAAALGNLRKLGLDRLLSQSGSHPKQEVTLCVAMIVARLIAPASKLAIGRLLDDEMATCSLGQVLGLEKVNEQQLYAALDWLLEQRDRIEAALARGHLKGGTAVLERAFRSLETSDLKIRPTYHRLRAHDLLCMLASHVEWHMREALKPVLFDDHDEIAVKAAHRSIVVADPRFEAA